MTRLLSAINKEKASTLVSLILAALLAFSLILLTSSIALFLWGPPGNELEEMAFSHRSPSIERECLLGLSVWWKEIVLGRIHPDVVTGLKHLATYYASNGRPNRSEACLKKSLDIQEAAYKDGFTISEFVGLDKLELTDTMTRLLDLYLVQERYPEAKQLVNKIWKLRGTGWDSVPELRRFGRQYRILARESGKADMIELPVQVKGRSWKEQKKKFDSAVAQQLKTYDAAALHWDNVMRYATDLLQMSHWYFIMGQYHESELALRKAVRLEEQIPSSFNVRFEPDLWQLALILQAQGKLNESESVFKEVLARIKAKDPTGGLYRQACLDDYADLLRELGREQEASQLK